MPAFNAAPFIGEAVSSILEQTMGDLELVVVDDGSTDATPAVLAAVADPRLVVIRQANGGVSSARNAGLAAAKGRYVVWQDADDVSLPNRLEVLLRPVTSERIGYVHSDMALIDAEGRPLGYWQSQAIDPHRLLRFFLPVGTPFNNPSMLLRREVLDGFEFDPALAMGEDSDLVFQLLPAWEGVHVPEPLLLYRRHATNATNVPSEASVGRHVEKFLAGHRLEHLVPEAPWSAPGQGGEATARAVVGLALARRGLPALAARWFEGAADCRPDADVARLLHGLTLLATGDCAAAVDVLAGCDDQDPVAFNYLGEALATIPERRDLAFTCFRRALALRGDYAEPLDNLRALAVARGFQPVDRNLLRYAA